MIDVVVPIYNAYETTVKCLNYLSVYDDLANEVYLINDASTDPRMTQTLKELAKKNSWQLLEVTDNQGFVKTANLGLKQSKNHTVLLNSDAFVSPYWLHGLKECLDSTEDLGTATVWSNNAELASFPSFLKPNEPFEKVEELSAWFRAFHEPEYPLIPTAVGFCMLITRQAKQSVGYFDEQHFGFGYGEENDYSMRVVKAGLKNVLCDNSYVTHIGNQSFTEKGLQPDANTMKRLLEKQPQYAKIIDEYIKADPLKTLREKILNNMQETNYALFELIKLKYG